jgi:hypothetical protein
MAALVSQPNAQLTGWYTFFSSSFSSEEAANLPSVVRHMLTTASGVRTMAKGQSAAQTSQHIPSDQELQLSIFSVLWAIAALFHMAHSSTFDSQLNLALLTIAAFYVIIRPTIGALLVLCMLQIFDAFYRMPFTTNHWIFTAFVNITIIGAWLLTCLKKKSFQPGAGAVFTTFAPAIRIEVMILYFFAVFHKLNSGFFAPATSCATDLLLAQQIHSIIPLPTDLLKWNAHFTITVESLIPLMLCFRKTRIAGIVIGLVFHGILSFSTYNAFYDFSSMVFALYFLFTLPSFSRKVAEHIDELKWRWRLTATPLVFKAKTLFAMTFFAIATFGILATLNQKLNDFRTVHLFFFWTIYFLLVVYAVVRFGFGTKEEKKSEIISFRLVNPLLWVLPLIVFLNGCSPYLGLKTENSYAMFSNLRTEGGISNHYLIPADVQIFDFQKQTVDIISSSDPYLQKLAGENKSLVLFEFRNVVHERNPEHIVFLYNGERHTYARGQNTAGTMLEKNSFILAKLMKFRAFSAEGEQPCSH